MGKFSVMRRISLIVAFMMLGIATPPAHAATVPADWGQDGYGPGNTRYNPAESVVNATSVGRLRFRWTATAAPGEPDCSAKPAAPLVVGSRVYLLGGGGLAAYDAATGRRAWLKTGLGLVTTTPIVAGGLVLVFGTSCHSNSDYDGSVTAFDAATGVQRWHRTASWTTDIAVADAGTVVVSGHCPTCGDAEHGVTAYRVIDGTELWKRANQVLAGPVSAGGTILLRPTRGSGETWASQIDGGTPVWGTSQVATAVAADPAGTQFYLKDGGGLCARTASEGRQLWTVPKEAGDLAADGRRVYVASAGRVNTYDARTGRLLWTRALTNPRMPVRAGGLLYVLTGPGTLAVLSPVDGKPVTTAAYTGLTRHVVLAGGRLFTIQGTAVRAYQ
jgi:outer membrane protein assembly factor BamB